jgi:hypothetical protein
MIQAVYQAVDGHYILRLDTTDLGLDIPVLNIKDIPLIVFIKRHIREFFYDRFNCV